MEGFRRQDIANKDPFAGAIIVQCATPDEFEALRLAFQSPEPQRAGRRVFFVVPRPGKGPDQPIVVMRGSLGKVFAAATTEFLVQAWKPTLAIDWGTAGSLTKDVHAGDMVLATKVVEYDVVSSRMKRKPEVVCHKKFQERMLEAMGEKDFVGQLHHGIIATGDRDVDGHEERKHIAGRTGAVATTWESSAIGRVAEFHGVCFAALRLITDTNTIEDYYTADKTILESAARVLRRAILPKK